MYATILGWPESGTVADVSLLGHDGLLTWRQDARGLTVEMPERKPCNYAHAFKIQTENEKRI